MNVRNDVPDELASRIANVELLLMDCDGVLTDGRLYYTDDGESMKAFDVKDGQGIVLWHAAGFRSGIITGRPGKGIVERRAAELKMEFIRDASEDKLADLNSILEISGLSPSQAAFVGDDIGDIPVMNVVGVSFAVADAHPTVRDSAAYVTKSVGGRGAVREVIDLILAAKRR